MKTYYVKFPGNFHPVSFNAEDEADARAQARAFLSIKDRKCQRLPNGTEVWEFTTQTRNIIRRSVQMMRRDFAKAGQIFD